MFLLRITPPYPLFEFGGSIVAYISNLNMMDNHRYIILSCTDGLSLTPNSLALFPSEGFEKLLNFEFYQIFRPVTEIGRCTPSIIAWGARLTKVGEWARHVTRTIFFPGAGAAVSEQGRLESHIG